MRRLHCTRKRTPRRRIACATTVVGRRTSSREVTPMLALLALLTMGPAPGPASATSSAGFDGDIIRADRNDWGKVEPVTLTGFRLTAPGEGCPLHLRARSSTPASRPMPRQPASSPWTDADLRQLRNVVPGPCVGQWRARSPRPPPPRPGGGTFFSGRRIMGSGDLSWGISGGE